MKEILELVVSGIGIDNDKLVIIEDYLSDYKYTEYYTELVEHTNTILEYLNNNYKTDKWEEALSLDIEDIIKL